MRDTKTEPIDENEPQQEHSDYEPEKGFKYKIVHIDDDFKVEVVKKGEFVLPSRPADALTIYDKNQDGSESFRCIFVSVHTLIYFDFDECRIKGGTFYSSLLEDEKMCMKTVLSLNDYDLIVYPTTEYKRGLVKVINKKNSDKKP